MGIRRGLLEMDVVEWKWTVSALPFTNLPHPYILYIIYNI